MVTMDDCITTRMNNGVMFRKASLQKRVMDNIEINDLAVRIIQGVRDDMQQEHYSPLGGELSIHWGEQNAFTASAHSIGELNEPPRHLVRLTYELARQIYRDAENFYEFLNGDIKSYSDFFYLYEPPSAPSLPPYIDKEYFLNNFFAAALTWVFAHEIGHLSQEHGYIRAKYGNIVQESAEIHECAATEENQILTPKASLISHATELAADFEATNWCFFEISRHFAKPRGDEAEPFIDGIFVFICAITCTFYRFNGLEAREPQTEPIGSHPHQIFRVEKNINQLIELIDMSRDSISVNLGRTELVHLYHRAASAASIFWLSQHAKPREVKGEFLVGGAMNHVNMRQYLPKIFAAWDEVRPEIDVIKRFNLGRPHPRGSEPFDLGLMSFTKQFRELFTQVGL
jgi:hypothetical protein